MEIWLIITLKLNNMLSQYGMAWDKSSEYMLPETYKSVRLLWSQVCIDTHTHIKKKSFCALKWYLWDWLLGINMDGWILEWLSLWQSLTTRDQVRRWPSWSQGVKCKSDCFDTQAFWEVTNYPSGWNTWASPSQIIWILLLYSYCRKSSGSSSPNPDINHHSGDFQSLTCFLGLTQHTDLYLLDLMGLQFPSRQTYAMLP